MRFPQPRTGQHVRNHPGGFPLYADGRKPRVVTANPRSFLVHLATSKLGKNDAARAHSFVSQAFDSYEAAQNPQIGSRPVLYYYSFLNLAKVALLLRRGPQFGEGINVR